MVNFDEFFLLICFFFSLRVGLIEIDDLWVKIDFNLFVELYRKSALCFLTHATYYILRNTAHHRTVYSCNVSIIVNLLRTIIINFDSHLLPNRVQWHVWNAP